MYALKNKQFSTAGHGKNHPVQASLFTPCTAAESLLIADTMAAKIKPPKDVLLISSACSNFDQFRNHQHRGRVLRAAAPGASADRAHALPEKISPRINFNLRRGFYEEKTPVQKTNITTTSQERTPTSAIAQ